MITNGKKTQEAIIGIVNNIGVVLLMSLFFMWIWNWLNPFEYELTYWKTVGYVYLLRVLYSTVTYNYFDTDTYKNKIKQ